MWKKRHACVSRTIGVTRCHYYMGFFFTCEQMASLGKIYNIIRSCIDIWYRAISVDRKGCPSAGELALYSGLVSCTSFITGNREDHRTEVPARGNCLRYCCSTSVLELTCINKVKCIVISLVNASLHLLCWQIACSGLIIHCCLAEGRCSTKTRCTTCVRLLYSVRVLYIKHGKTSVNIWRRNGRA